MQPVGTLKIEGEELLALIPQRPPIVMIDRLTYHDELVTRTGFEVKDSNIFCENGLLTESGLIENIAQTAAVGAGYAYSKVKKTPPIGFIGAIKDLTIFSLPALGKIIATEIKIENQIFGVTLVSGKIMCEDELIASCEMKIFIKEE